MKQKGLRVILIGASTVAIYASAAGVVQAQPCRSGPGDCKAGGAKTCAVDVALEKDAAGQCSVVSLDKNTKMVRHKVQACHGDTVRWAIDNKCGQDVTIEVGNFRVDQEIVDRHKPTQASVGQECIDKDPFTGAARIKARRAKTTTMTRRVAGQHFPRTYKYDIVVVGPGGKRKVLDPEAEIYR